MKGLVFTTFFDFCEVHYGADLVDDAIALAELPHHGAYTSVGTYPFQEIVALVTAVTKLTKSSMPAVLESFGEHCFASWVKKFPATFDHKDIFDVLANIDTFHETEVKKLYPDAELPSFKVVSRTTDRLVLHYRSCKPLADLAIGVIRGAALYLNATLKVSYRKTGEAIEFDVRRPPELLAA
jgi:hypothetical protein